MVEYVTSADLPVNPYYTFLGCLGIFLVLFVCLFDFLLVFFLTSLAIKFPLILPVLTGNPNSLHLGNELILCSAGYKNSCVRCLAYVLIGFSSQEGKTTDQEVRKGVEPTKPLLLHHASARFV